MFDLGIQELIVIFAVAIIVFGPKKLPELSRNLGKGIGQLKKALFDVKYEINREMNVLDEEHGKSPGEPKWKKEALDAIYGGKGPVSGGVQGPGPEHPEHEEKPPEETKQDEGRDKGAKEEDTTGGGAPG
jgi:TatA/E family protein of Tat protein translocase